MLWCIGPPHRHRFQSALPARGAIFLAVELRRLRWFQSALPDHLLLDEASQLIDAIKPPTNSAPLS